MPDKSTDATQTAPSHSLPAMSLAALGVVFGDIGTSPLYALKTVLDVTSENPPTEILGALSLIVWTLIIITSVKYIPWPCVWIMTARAAFSHWMALLRMRDVRQALVVLIGLFGAGGSFVRDSPLAHVVGSRTLPAIHCAELASAPAHLEGLELLRHLAGLNLFFSPPARRIDREKCNHHRRIVAYSVPN